VSKVAEWEVLEAAADMDGRAAKMKAAAKPVQRRLVVRPVIKVAPIRLGSGIALDRV